MTVPLQWNCRGYHSNKHELDLFISKLSPSAICLQETFMPHSIGLRGYVTYEVPATVDQDNRPHGGIALLVKDSIPQSTVTINTNLQAVAARITLDKTITVCSIYLSPSQPIDLNELNNLYNQLPAPAIILEDFKAHSILWGNDKTNQKGEQIEKFLTDNNLCLWNDDSPTHLQGGTKIQETQAMS